MLSKAIDAFGVAGVNAEVAALAEIDASGVADRCSPMLSMAMNVLDGTGAAAEIAAVAE